MDLHIFSLNMLEQLQVHNCLLGSVFVRCGSSGGMWASLDISVSGVDLLSLSPGGESYLQFSFFFFA